MRELWGNYEITMRDFQGPPQERTGAESRSQISLIFHRGPGNYHYAQYDLRTAESLRTIWFRYIPTQKYYAGFGIFFCYAGLLSGWFRLVMSARDNINRTKHWMWGYQSERLELSARVTCTRSSVQFIANIVVSYDCICTTKCVCCGSVQQGDAATSANSGLVRASGAEAQPHRRDKFDRSERESNVSRALP